LFFGPAGAVVGFKAGATIGAGFGLFAGLREEVMKTSLYLLLD